MTQALLDKSKLSELIVFLAARQKVVGPIALGHRQFKFAEIHSLAEMTLTHPPTILPPKKYFMPPRETLLQYSLAEGQQMQALVEVEELVIFGVHTCDLAGIQCLNVVFADRPRDLHSIVRKNYLTLIGLECNDYCDRHANCAMFQNHLPKGGYDLFFSSLAAVYYVDINTRQGEQLLEESGLFEPVTAEAQKQLQELRKKKKKLFKNELPIRYQEIPQLFEDTFDSQIWAQIGERCLSCGNCTTVCPSCYCFDMMDEPELDLNHGRRLRVWDSCQLEDFAMVAGGENFRASRGERQRHRFNRKFHYPVERYKRFFCTGCGRCSRTCMAKIDLKETINALIEERG